MFKNVTISSMTLFFSKDQLIVTRLLLVTFLLESCSNNMLPHHLRPKEKKEELSRHLILDKRGLLEGMRRNTKKENEEQKKEEELKNEANIEANEQKYETVVAEQPSEKPEEEVVFKGVPKKKPKRASAKKRRKERKKIKEAKKRLILNNFNNSQIFQEDKSSSELVSVNDSRHLKNKDLKEKSKEKTKEENIAKPLFCLSIRIRTGLDLELPFQTALLEQLTPGYELGTAYGEGDCFFDALAQWVNKINHTEVNTDKYLRMLCHVFYLKNKALVDDWNQKDYGGIDKGKENYYMVQYTAEECERELNGRSSIWGRPWVEGRILCKELQLNGICIIEVLINPETGKPVVSYHLVGQENYKPSISEGKGRALIQEGNIPVLVNVQGKLHFVPLWKKNKTLYNVHNLEKGRDTQLNKEAKNLGNISLGEKENINSREEVHELEKVIASTNLQDYVLQQQLFWIEKSVNVGNWPTTLHASWRDPQLLIRMIKEGASEQVIKVLIEKAGLTIDTRDEAGGTALHAAVRRGGEDALKQIPVLIQLGAEREAQDQYNITPLELAAEQKDIATFKLLIELGAGERAITNKINCFYQALSAEEKEKLVPYIAKLAQANPKVGWKVSLDELFPIQDKCDKKIEVNSKILKTATEGERIISEEIWCQLFDKDGRPQKTNKYGVRSVPFVEKYGQRIYVKFEPQLPGTELAVTRLAENLLGYCAPYCEFATINDVPILLIQEIPGKTLYEVLTHHPEQLHRLDPESASSTLILAMLVNPGDGNLGNYIVSPFINQQGEELYRLISIDNEQAFMPAVARSISRGWFSSTLSLQVKTILYCLDILNDKVSVATVGKIKSVDLINMLESWLISLKIHHKAVMNHFDSELLKKYQKTKTTVLGVAFAPGMIKQLFTKLMRLQIALNKKKVPTHLELLEILEPFIANRYKPVLNELKLNVIEKFKKVENINQESALTSSCNPLGWLLESREIPNIEVLQKALWSGEYGPDQALKELQEIKEQHTSWQQISKDLIKLDPQKFINSSFINSPAAIFEALLKKADLSNLSFAQQRSLLEAIKDKELRYTNLKGCVALTGPILGTFNLQHVKKLDLSDCSELGAISLGTFVDYPIIMPALTHLRLYQSGVSGIYLQAEQLKKLRAQNCSKLERVKLIAPQLDILDIREAAVLQKTEIESIFDRFPHTFIYITPTKAFPQNVCAKFLYKYFLACKKENKKEELAICYLNQSAHQDNKKAQYTLGQMYEKRIVVEKNQEAAIELYIKAANQGHKYAPDALSELALKGIKLAQEWIIEKAKKRDQKAQYILGQMYEQGIGISKDEEKAAELYIKAANQEEYWSEKKPDYAYEALRSLALKGIKLAQEWAIEKAGKEEQEAQYTLGKMYEQGVGVKRDEEKAAELYIKVANQEECWSEKKPGGVYEALRSLALKGIKLAQKWVIEKAEKGDKEAQYTLGKIYGDGSGIEKNYKESVKWYQKAADQGNTSAQYTLGCIYRNGEGITQDYKEALRWFQKAAEQGNAKAQYNLGDMYEYGKGVDQDYREALKWYQKAAEQGNVDAQYNLGWIYYYGEEVDKDEQKARSSYLKAVGQDNTSTQYNLRWIYQRIDTKNPDDNMIYLLYSFYFVRHGQTDWGAEDILKGPQDLRLNSVGLQQAHEAGSILKNLLSNSTNPRMVSSTLVRAVETAKEIEKATGIPISAQEDGLKERYYGDYRLVSTDSTIPPDAEAEEEFQKRVLQSLCKLLLEYKQARPLIIVSHQRVLECVSEFLVKHPERLSQGGIGYFMLKGN